MSHGTVEKTARWTWEAGPKRRQASDVRCLARVVLPNISPHGATASLPSLRLPLPPSARPPPGSLFHPPPAPSALCHDAHETCRPPLRRACKGSTSIGPRDAFFFDVISYALLPRRVRSSSLCSLSFFPRSSFFRSRLCCCYCLLFFHILLFENASALVFVILPRRVLNSQLHKLRRSGVCGAESVRLPPLLLHLHHTLKVIFSFFISWKPLPETDACRAPQLFFC